MARLQEVAGGFAPAVDITELAEQDLARSGITLEEAEAAGMFPVTASEAVAFDARYALPCLRIPYYDLDGNPMSSCVGYGDFFRYRFLVEPPVGPDGKKPQRYGQPKDSGVAAYLPKIVDWRDVASNVDEDIVFTEGEKKALKACLDGITTIGLGGVYNFRSAKDCIPFLPELEEIDWRRRKVFIAYDSDLVTNPMVAMAVNKLSEELQLRGAIVGLVILPMGMDNEKQGLDDLLVAAGPDEFRKLMKVADPLRLSGHLWKANEQYAYVKELHHVAKIGSAQLRNLRDLQEEIQDLAYSRVVNAKGDVTLEKVNMIKDWASWPMRREVDTVEYIPGEAPLAPYEPEQGPRSYNLWSGWGCKPVEGDPGKFIQLVDHLFTGADDGAKEWFLRWCAYPLQHPGTKMATAVMIHSRHQGTGKSLMFHVLGRIYGDNFSEVNQKKFQDSFNSWAANKQFVLGDDVTSLSTREKRQDLDWMKKLITQESLEINIKHQPQYVIRDTVNYAFTSQHDDALYMEDGDRRFFIHRVRAEMMKPEWYADFMHWLDHEGGKEAVFHYLLNIDLGDFNPKAPAFVTTDKREMTDASKGQMGEWVDFLKTYPDDVLKIGEAKFEYDLATSRDVMLCYASTYGLDETRLSPNLMGKLMREAGFEYANAGNPIRAKGKPLGRYFIVRNKEKWLKADHQDMMKHLSSKVKTPKF